MISDLTKIVKSETSQMKRESLSFKEITEEVFEHLAKEISNHQADVSFDFSACPTTLYGKVELKKYITKFVE